MSHTDIPGHAVPLDAQVGGHAGVLTSEDGSVIIKPALPKEHAFYASIAADPQLAALRPYVPTFYGTLTEGAAGANAMDLATAAGSAGVVVSPPSGKESIVLENVSAEFTKPNILDVKLGTVLYDDEANDDKKERMLKAARDTTTFETGVRLTGFRVWDPKGAVFVNTPKAYGKSIKASQLPEGMAKFFPDPETASGRNAMIRVIDGLVKDITTIKQVLSEIELRMVGGSLLIVWEGDEETLREALARPPPEEKDDEDSDDEDDAKKSPGYAVKLIDFAHTKLVPGQGPDAGVLLGVQTTLDLLQGRRAELEKLAA